MKRQTIRCPYCGSTAILRDASYVYGDKSRGGQLYVCSHYPACDSYVGVHPGTVTPKGTLADKKLRIKRIEAHRMFDQIWRQDILPRKEAYHWMADKFGLDYRFAHIGYFSDYMCDQLIIESVKVLRSNHIRLAAAG